MHSSGYSLFVGGMVRMIGADRESGQHVGVNALWTQQTGIDLHNIGPTAIAKTA